MTPWTKRLAIALAVSLALNLLIGGFLLGRGLRRPEQHGPFMRPMPSALHARERGPWRKFLQGHRDELRARQGALRAARRDAREALAKPNFDAAELERTLAAVRAETAQGQEQLHRALVEAAKSASPEQRRELARFLDAR